MNNYELGDLVRCSVVFTTVADSTPLDPTDVYFSYKDPSGNLTELHYGVDIALVKDDVGEYHVDIDADEEGIWYTRGYATGTGQSAVQGVFQVIPATAI